jgi:HSP20 family protein
MSEVAVSQKTPEAPVVSRPSEIFQPMFALGRFSSLNPFAMMREFASEMDRMFRGNGSGAELQVWAPSLDVQQCHGNLTVSVELPGLKKEEVKVEATDDTLIIQGERKQEHKEDHEGYHRWERNYGRFYRAIPLPEGAKTDQVKAELKDGVLKVSVPTPETKNNARQIPVAG